MTHKMSHHKSINIRKYMLYNKVLMEIDGTASEWLNLPERHNIWNRQACDNIRQKLANKKKTRLSHIHRGTFNIYLIITDETRRQENH